MSLQRQTKSTAFWKGLYAAASVGGTVAGAVLIGWPLAVVGGVASAWFTYDWFRFRAQWGMRF